MRAVVLLCLLFGGCEGGPPLVEIGTGASRFEPLEDGQSMPLVAGAQGGFHLWISARARGIDPSDVHLTVVSSYGDRSFRTSDRSFLPSTCVVGSSMQLPRSRYLEQQIQSQSQPQGLQQQSTPHRQSAERRRKP